MAKKKLHEKTARELIEEMAKIWIKLTNDMVNAVEITTYKEIVNDKNKQSI